MAYEHKGVVALDYYPCRYGTSKLLFRGPKRKLEGAYCAVLGSTETYGKFIEHPYPVLVEQATGMVMVNFGCVNAGTDVFVNDTSVMEACRGAVVTVVQVTGAHNISNRFYAVHPRRNDRFLHASPLMKSMFREVDFTEFHFTRHMLSTLQTLSPSRFGVVAEELRTAWVARMRLLLDRVGGRVVLLWMAGHTPDEASGDGGMGRDPLLVDRTMIEALRPLTAGVVEIRASAEALGAGVAGMAYTPMDAPAAAELPGPLVHQEVATALGPVIRGFC